MKNLITFTLLLCFITSCNSNGWKEQEPITMGKREIIITSRETGRFIYYNLRPDSDHGAFADEYLVVDYVLDKLKIKTECVKTIYYSYSNSGYILIIVDKSCATETKIQPIKTSIP